MSLTRSTGRMVGIVVGMIVVLLALPLAVVLLVSGHLPVTGILVSGMLLFAAVWLVIPPRAQG